MGASLGTAFHKAGHHVFATGRNLDKLSDLSTQGIQTLSLDVTSADSITAAVSTVTSSLPPNHTGLDMLINNAAASYSMPIADISIPEAKAIFDLNVWAPIAVTQAFLPLLLQSSVPKGSMVVNHSSVGSTMAVPFQSSYNASKAALSMFTATLRLELAPFGVRVVELKTGGVRTNFIANNTFHTAGQRLPEESIYAPAREVVDVALSQEGLMDKAISVEEWTEQVVGLLLREEVPREIWRGKSAFLGRVASWLPSVWFEGMMKRMTKLDVVEGIIGESKKGGKEI